MTKAFRVRKMNFTSGYVLPLRGEVWVGEGDGGGGQGDPNRCRSTACCNEERMREMDRGMLGCERAALIPTRCAVISGHSSKASVKVISVNVIKTYFFFALNG